MDLLGSILGTMEKPPTLGEDERKKVKEQKALIEKQQEKEKKKLQDFREKMQSQIQQFMKDSAQQKKKFSPMDKVYRAIIHEVADIAGLTSFSFGIEEQDRYVMLWKKEFAPTDEELLAYRREEEWDPDKAKALVKQREQLNKESQYLTHVKRKGPTPNSDYKDKYRHLIGDTSAKDAAQSVHANKSYGIVPSENKRDQRTVEQVLADSQAKKKLKAEHNSSQNQPAQSDSDTSSQSSLPCETR